MRPTSKFQGQISLLLSRRQLESNLPLGRLNRSWTEAVGKKKDLGFG